DRRDITARSAAAPAGTARAEPARMTSVKRSTSRANVLAALAIGAAIGGGACFGASAKKTESCDGQERCACYPNGTCNAGLVCLSDLCVSGSPDDAGLIVR